MKRSEVRAFIKSGVDALTDSVEFGSGLLTYFNSNRNHSYPAVFMELSDVSSDINIPTSLPLDTWPITLHIADKDSVDSIPDQYEEIIDRMDEIAQKLVFKYNAIVSGYKNVSIANVNRLPFVKLHSDCVTGVILTFDVIAPDKTNNC